MSGFPHELIRQVQISTRAAAGLAGYDPADQTLPDLPSVSAAVASLEPSPPHLRCQHCKGRLLRGLQSRICVYCGSRCQHDIPSDPIFFTSTVGYQWLLRYLNLDGSEIVKTPTNKNEQDQSQSSPKAEIPLSNFLKLKISSLSEEEKRDTVVSDKHPEERKGFSSLTRIAPDNFLFNSTADVDPIGTTGTKKTGAPANISSFQSIQSLEHAGRSSIDKPTEAFSEWEADWKSAVSEEQHGFSESSEHLMGLPADSAKEFQDSQLLNVPSKEIDLSAHMDSVFGCKTDPNDGNPTHKPVASPTSDWNSDDLWANKSSSESRPASILDATVNVKGNNLSSSDDFFQDFQWQSDRTDTLENETTNAAFSSMNDSQVVAGFNANVSAKDDQTVESTDNVPSNVDLFQDFQWQAYDTELASKKTTSAEQSTINQPQLVDEFFETVNAKYGHTENSDDISTNVDLFQDFQWLNGETGTAQAKKMNNEKKTVSEDSFGEWNEFTGSTSAQESSHFSNSHGKSSEMDLFSPNSQYEDRNLDSSAQPTAFSALAGVENSATEIQDSLSETSSNRLRETSIASYESGQTANNANGIGISSNPQDDVTLLISRMHDLSFMLKNDLCISSTPGSVKSPTRD